MKLSKKWAEEHLDGEEYEKIFGAVEEVGDEKKACTFSLSAATIEKIKRGAAEQGLTLSAYIEKVIGAE